jgi:elongation factor P--(R)-beta-lysine ligase
MDIRLLKERSRILTETRDFFLARDYLETDTPALAPSLIPESCLEVFKTEYDNPFVGSMDLWLVPSPEVWMKPLIAKYKRSVFQICKCFRNAESIGRIHNPEFTMLEYYTVGGTAASSIGITEELFRRCAGPDTPESSLPPFRRMSMAEAFRELAGLDLNALQDRERIIEAGRGKGLLIQDDASWEDAFNQVFLSLVENHLPEDRPLALERYPAQIDCLAADIPGTPWKDRWELYVRGVELCNCYTEASDPDAVRASFQREAERKRASRVPHRVDFSYPDIFTDFPPCSGVALGFDRFVLALTGATDIGELLPYPFERILKDNKEALRPAK